MVCSRVVSVMANSYSLFSKQRVLSDVSVGVVKCLVTVVSVVYLCNEMK